MGFICIQDYVENGIKSGKLFCFYDGNLNNKVENLLNFIGARTVVILLLIENSFLSLLTTVIHVGFEFN
jgi:hypothetical protein